MQGAAFVCLFPLPRGSIRAFSFSWQKNTNDYSATRHARACVQSRPKVPVCQRISL
ncbi:hypothetical protein MTBLM1_60313 [Rhodospirillaceae bacterium LM-1]|nr:hypothetical protein MTBLM1_60313 [Rhodospirillaceae bacterium LM-1]